MQQFLNDMVHLTEGEKLVKYWWLWLSLFTLAVIITWLMEMRRSRD